MDPLLVSEWTHGKVHGELFVVRVADEMQHPRAIEVLTGMIKQQSENAHALLAMHKKNQDINVTQAKGSPEEQKALTQNVFVGSTAELQKMLRGDVIEHESE